MLNFVVFGGFDSYKIIYIPNDAREPIAVRHGSLGIGQADLRVGRYALI